MVVPQFSVWASGVAHTQFVTIPAPKDVYIGDVVMRDDGKRAYALTQAKQGEWCWVVTYPPILEARGFVKDGKRYDVVLNDDIMR